MGCFLLMVFWSPYKKVELRWVLLQAAFGSTLTWLDASRAFLFYHERLADVEVAYSGVREVVRKFATTAMAAHTSEKATLPQYNNSTPSDVLDEKAALLALNERAH
jgi:hypothetical protein